MAFSCAAVCFLGFCRFAGFGGQSITPNDTAFLLPDAELCTFIASSRKKLYKLKNGVL
jgi:hypothetical protein